MVKPTVALKGAKKVSKDKVLMGNALIEKIKTDAKFREQALLNTANRIAQKYGKAVDITYNGVQDSGKSFKIAFDGKESPSKYVAVPYTLTDTFPSRRFPSLSTVATVTWMVS